MGRIFLVGALLSVFGCEKTTDFGPRYVDLLTSPEEASRFKVRLPEVHFCADQTTYSWMMKSEARLSFAVELGQSAKLQLAGCANPAPEGDGWLEVTVESQDGRTVVDSIPLRQDSSWWSRELDLGELAGTTGTIRLATHFEKGPRLMLTDLYLLHEVPLSPRLLDQPQLLLISLDTFRADAIAALGGLDPTPTLDHLIEESQTWLAHYSAAAMTKPAHATLLTGQFAWLHGALQNETPIRAEVPTLAERFHDAGFRTAGFVKNPWLDEKFGFGRGFEKYRNVQWTLPQEVRAIATWTSDHRAEPFFLFFHTMEAHSDSKKLPYEAPYVTQELVSEKFKIENYGCREERCATSYLRWLNQGLEPLPGEREILRFLYGRSVMHLDDQLGILFDHLREIGIYDDMMIVVTSDHGEAFLEHGKVLHGIHWEEVLRVPLIIKWPGGHHAGERVGTPSSGIDVAPTLLNAFGLSTDGLPGAILPQRRPDEPVFIATGWNAVISDGLKLVDRKPVARKEKVRDRLFDIREEKNIAAQRPEQVEALQRLLAARIEIDRQRAERLAEVASEPSLSFTEGEREQLKALGYM